MNIDWNAKGYQKDFAFVPKYGEAVLDLIDAAPGALAVDLGCGNGGLTGKPPRKPKTLGRKRNVCATSPFSLASTKT